MVISRRLRNLCPFKTSQMLHLEAIYIFHDSFVLSELCRFRKTMVIIYTLKQRIISILLYHHSLSQSSIQQLLASVWCSSATSAAPVQTLSRMLAAGQL
jgi:hypothetical protein